MNALLLAVFNEVILKEEWVRFNLINGLDTTLLEFKSALK